MTRFITILSISLCLVAQAGAQAVPPVYGPNDTITVYATFLEDGTLVPTSALPMVEVVGKMPRWMAKKKKEMTRLRNAVYVTYPYAREAGRIINYMNKRMAGMTDERTRNAFIKMQEKELKTAFGDKITQLSVYQGKVLMKLINRETGSNVFDILKEYRGGVNARLWQTIAFVFGSSLKQPYNALGEDAEIEGYVREVQMLYGG
jgi:hypothetical protein